MPALCQQSLPLLMGQGLLVSVADFGSEFDLILDGFYSCQYVYLFVCFI